MTVFFGCFEILKWRNLLSKFGRLLGRKEERTLKHRKVGLLFIVSQLDWYSRHPGPLSRRAPGKPAVVAGAQQKQIPVSDAIAFLPIARFLVVVVVNTSISWLQKGLSSYSQLSSCSYMKKVCVFVLCLDSDKYLHVFFNGQKQLSSLRL